MLRLGQVVELYQALSASMDQLQNIIVAAMQACLQELRRSNVKEVLQYSPVCALWASVNRV